MKRLLWVVLTLLPVALRAATADYRIEPVTGDKMAGNDQYGLYYGHYGEVFRYRTSWSIRPEIHGHVEVVRIHVPSRLDENRESIKFNLPDSDWVPENFTKHRLIQLVVLPKDAPGITPLPKARIDREAGLAGMKYSILDGEMVRPQAPENSFEVMVRSPYCLKQLYSHTPTHIYILSGGCDVGGGGLMSDQYDMIRDSLLEWLYAQSAPVQPRVSWKILSNQAVRLSTGLALGLCVLLACLGRISERAARAGKGGLIVGASAALFAFVAGLCLPAPTEFYNNLILQIVAYTTSAATLIAFIWAARKNGIKSAVVRIALPASFSIVFWWNLTRGPFVGLPNQIAAISAWLCLLTGAWNGLLWGSLYAKRKP